MLVKGMDKRGSQAEIVTMEELVPKEHLLRKVAAAISFDFIYELVEDKYSVQTGRPSIDPVVLIKMVLLQFLFGIRSMRQTVQEIEVNAAYRWFLGMSWQDKVPHFTTFGKNYKRRFEGTDLFEQIFARVLQACYRAGYVKGEEVFVDTTHIKANANRNKKLKQQVKHEAHVYARELRAEINAERQSMDKEPFDDDEDEGTDAQESEVTQSTTDPESGMFVKGEHERNFAYMAQTACNRHGFILGYEVIPGNIHDSKSFWGLYKHIRHLQMSHLVADSAYKTPAILRRLFYDEVIPLMPYTRPKTKEGYFTKKDYQFDSQQDCYICPQGQMLRHTNTNRDGYREYRSRAKVCRQCPCRMQCTQSKNCVKILNRHIWQEFVDTAEDIRRTPEGKELYKKRKETIERVFADAKEKHGMRFTQYRGLAKVKMQVSLTFTCMNLKKLATWLGKSPPKGTFPSPFVAFSSFFSLIFSKYNKQPVLA